MPSSELKPIILYDIPCITPGRPWSPNTMKTRYCLGYKQLPFTTVWVELPDIVGLLQSKGVTHAPYTLPAIEDPNTGKLIIDSLMIATYLDETYPETPKVLNPAAHAALEGVEDVFSLSSNTNASTDTGGDCPSRLIFLTLATERLNPVSKTYYHQKRMARHSEHWTTLRGFCSAGTEDRAERVRQGIETFKGVWDKVTALYGHEGDPNGGKSTGPFVLGEEPCLLDFSVAGRIKLILDGLTPSEAEVLANVEGGMLGRLVESLERFFRY